MLAGDDHAVYVGPNEGRLEPPEAWRRVRGGPHRVRRSAGADPRRPEPFRAGGPRNHCGPLDRGRLLLVSFTERVAMIRIISARRATRHERQDYEKATRS